MLSSKVITSEKNFFPWLHQPVICDWLHQKHDTLEVLDLVDLKFIVSKSNITAESLKICFIIISRKSDFKVTACMCKCLKKKRKEGKQHMLIIRKKLIGKIREIIV